MFRRRKAGQDSTGAAPVYRGLRDQALHTPPQELGFEATPDHPRVYGVLMETAYENGTATLASFCDGSTSLYTSTGGGVIGGGAHPTVASATKGLVAAAEHFLGAMLATTSYPSPALGCVRFQVLTFDGGFTAEVEEQALGENRDRLSPLFYAAHEVITRLREIEESGERR